MSSCSWFCYAMQFDIENPEQFDIENREQNYTCAICLEPINEITPGHQFCDKNCWMHDTCYIGWFVRQICNIFGTDEVIAAFRSVVMQYLHTQKNSNIQDIPTIKPLVVGIYAGIDGICPLCRKGVSAKLLRALNKRYPAFRWELCGEDHHASSADIIFSLSNGHYVIYEKQASQSTLSAASKPGDFYVQLLIVGTITFIFDDLVLKNRELALHDAPKIVHYLVLKMLGKQITREVVCSLMDKQLFSDFFLRIMHGLMAGITLIGIEQEWQMFDLNLQQVLEECPWWFASVVTTAIVYACFYGKYVARKESTGDNAFIVEKIMYSAYALLHYLLMYKAARVPQSWYEGCHAIGVFALTDAMDALAMHDKRV